MDEETQDNIEEKAPSDADRALVEAQEEARTNLAGWQRSQADFENYKRREEGKQAEILDFAKEVTLVKMLPTLDSLEQGLKQTPQQDAPDFADKFAKWHAGIEGVLQKLGKVLEEMGVKKIDAVGKQFDPHFHEAIRQVPGDEDDVVVEELQTGYELSGRVIRPSQVVISKKG